jgi:murein DD-endopeptidase MepM/ murein hydrolase activator NlpD
MKTTLAGVAGAGLIAVLAGLWFLAFERQPPEASLPDAPSVVGVRAAFDVAVEAPASPGLRRVEVRLLTAGIPITLAEKTYPSGGLLRGGVASDALRVDADLAALGVAEGHAQIEVRAETHGWRLSGAGPHVVALHPVTIDVTPPRIALVTTQHNLRLGGTALAVFRASGADRAEIVVGPYRFPATRGGVPQDDTWIAVFAVPQDLDTEATATVRAADAVGNASEAALPVAIRGRRFADRTLAISEAFLRRKVPEVYAANGLTAPGDLVEGYLFINRVLRQQSEERLRGLTATSAPQPLWDGSFVRQPNAAPMSGFADRRIYEHAGKIIDRQTHLGYDLASLRNADVVATQNGVVVFADNLGIYGITVVLDHGLGVFSLYGHLSTVAVDRGQEVKAGDVIGQSGETGLAGGDHLHFSVMVSGIHVDPVEWWDPAWMRDHVTAKLRLLPAAAAGTPTPPAG